MSTGFTPYLGSPYHAQQALPLQSGYPSPTATTGQFLSPPHHLIAPSVYPPIFNPYNGGFNGYGVPASPHGIPYGVNFLAPYYSGYQFPGATVNAGPSTWQASHQLEYNSPLPPVSVTVASHAAIPDDDLLEDDGDDLLESVLYLKDSDIISASSNHPIISQSPQPRIPSTIQQDKPSGKRRGSEAHAAFIALYAVYCDAIFHPKVKFFDMRDQSVEYDCARKTTYANWIWSKSIKGRVREDPSLKEDLIGYAKFIKSGKHQATRLFCLKNAGIFELHSDVLIYAPNDYQDKNGKWCGASVTVISSTEEMRKGLRFRCLNDAQTNIVYQVEYDDFQQRLVHVMPNLRKGDSSGPNTTMATPSPGDCQPILSRTFSKHAVAVTEERPGTPMARDKVMQLWSLDSDVQSSTDDNRVASPQDLLKQPIERTPTPPRRCSPESTDALRRASMMQMKYGGRLLFYDFDNAGGKDLIDAFADMEKNDGPMFTFDSPITNHDSPNLMDAFSGSRYFKEDAIDTASDDCQVDPICGHEIASGDPKPPLSCSRHHSRPLETSTKRPVSPFDRPSSLPVKRSRSSVTVSSSASGAPSTSISSHKGFVQVTNQKETKGATAGDINITISTKK